MGHMVERFITYKGMMKLFHAPMKLITMTVMVTGFRSGKTILRNRSKPLLPSITADSSSSTGPVFTNP